MAENFIMVSQQVIILFLLIGVGFLCGKTKLLNENAAKKMTDLVLYIVTPCVMINAFQREFNSDMLLNLGITALCSALIMTGSIFAVNIIVKDKDIARRKALRFGTVFSNCGFMSLPLQSAILGKDGVFYGSVFVAVFNIIIWTYGLFSMSGRKSDLSVKKLLLNPGVLGVIAGLLLFLMSVELPSVLASPVEYLANLNTPVPMIIIGFYLAGANLKKVFSDKWAYVSMSLRLIFIPILSIFAMYACGVRGDISVSCSIASCAPVAATTTMFATKFKADVELSVGIVSATTLLSVATMPIIISAAMALS